MPLPFRFILVFLAIGALAGATGSHATPSGKAQRIMLVQTQQFGATNGRFELRVLAAGQLHSDDGTYTFAADARPHVVRRGQRLAVYDAVAKLASSRGTLELRWRVEYAGAGAGNTVGMGRWTVTRGTGSYARTTGGGRLASVIYTPRGVTSFQLEGLLVTRSGTTSLGA